LDVPPQRYRHPSQGRTNTGHYLIRYNHVGSFPDELGRKLVAKFPKEPAEYQSISLISVLTSEWKAGRQKSLDKHYARWLKCQPTPKPTKFTLLEDSKTELDLEAGVDIGRRNLDARDYTWDIYNDGAWSEFPPEDDCMIEWIYTIDLDRDAFTVDWIASFNMLNWPQDWEEHVETNEEGRRCVPTKLAKEYLVTDVFAKPPAIDEAMLKRYEELHPEPCDPPTPTNEVKMNILMQLQRDLEMFKMCPYDVVSKEWTIHDIPMQKFIYCLVKFSCWESLEFKLKKEERNVLEVVIPTWLNGAEYPRGTEYYVPTGDKDQQILISLCTHLDQEEVRKMAVARVVDKMKMEEDGRYTACIVSLTHIVMVRVFKHTDQMKVYHTEPMEIFGETSEGRKTLIALLSSPDLKSKAPIGPARAVSADEIGDLFEALSLAYGGHATQSNFHEVAKDASNVLHGRTIRFPGRTLMTHKTWLEGCMYGIDDDGAIGLYGMSDHQYPLLWESQEVAVKSYKVLVDGADFGIGVLNLIPVDVGNILNPPKPEDKPKPKEDIFPAGFGESVDISHMFNPPK
jgi:hypothetical protein